MTKKKKKINKYHNVITYYGVWLSIIIIIIILSMT